MFTEETDLWWRRGPKYRLGGRNPGSVNPGSVIFETGPGGRLMETFGTRVVEMGRITAWEPPSRFCFEWRGSNFAEGEKTDVEVLFQAVGENTYVTVHHRGWAALRPDHPVRHGADGTAFIRAMAMWWGEQLTALRELAV